MYKKILKKVLAVMLCLSFLAATVTVEPVQAQRAAGESVADYVNRCYNSMMPITALNPQPKIMAIAYLVGEDDMAAASWERDPVTFTSVTQDIYAVEPGTQIQGYTYNSKYYPQDNIDYIKDVQDNYPSSFPRTNRIYRMPKGVQYIELEGEKFRVVACDEEWVTVWDNGYQAWNLWDGMLASTFACIESVKDSYMETHPAGFYRIRRNKVWLDFCLKENHPYTSEAAIPKAGNGVVTKLAKLRPVADEGENTYPPVYALPTGTKVNVVSTQPVSSKTPGSTVTYYKVSFNGSEKVQNNNVGYLKYQVPGVYYLDSRYLNVTWKGKKTPAGGVTGVITGSVYAYKSKDTGSERVGILSTNAEIEIFPSESDANWTAVYFSGQKAYVQTKYIKYKVTDISKLRVADVVKDQIKMTWDAGKCNVDYSCSISMKKGKKTTVLWSNKHYKKNTLIIKRKYIEKNAAKLIVKVQATDINGKKGKTLSCDIDELPRNESKIKKKDLVIGKNKIKAGFAKIIGESVQYSTNKKFKKAKTLERYEKSTKQYDIITSIKKLKKNKTYYIRRRDKRWIETAAGTKWLSGKWSKSIKVKTKK